MNNVSGNTAALKGVAAIFVFYAVLEGAEFVWGMVNSGNRDAIIPCLFYSLLTNQVLSRKALFRTLALVHCWVFMAVPVFAIPVYLAGPLNIEIGIFGIIIVDSVVGFLAVTVPVALLSAWQYRVLTRPEIKLLFATGISGQQA